MNLNLNIRAIRAIIRKDLSMVFRNRMVTLPMIIVPLIFLVIMPGLSALAPVIAPDVWSVQSDVDEVLSQMPPALLSKLADLNAAQGWIMVTIVYFGAPLFLIIPTMVANVIAADSIVGEKERKTMEGLLYTPTTDRDILVGKLLAAWLPALGIALGGFVLYSLVANIAAWPVMGRVYFPNLMWLVLITWFAPAVAGMGLGAMLVVSTRVNSVQEAYQLGTMVILPIVLLLIGQTSGLLYFNVGLVILLGLLVWIVDAAVLRYAIHSFQRGEIIARL